VTPYLYVFGVFAGTPVQTAQLQRFSNNRRTEVPILRMKEVEALAENLALMVVLDAEPLLGVQSSETLLQLLENVLVYRGVGAVPRFFSELKIHSSPLAHLLCAGPQGKARWLDQVRNRTENAANARRRIFRDSASVAKHR
jgi:hypothetical protein